MTRLFLLLLPLVLGSCASLETALSGKEVSVSMVDGKPQFGFKFGPPAPKTPAPVAVEPAK